MKKKPQMPSRKLVPALIVAAMCSAGAPAAESAPSSEGFALPGLISDPSGSVTAKAASVLVMAGNITLDITVTTSADNPGLIVQGPTFGAADAAEPYPDRQFPELAIRLDGTPVTPAEIITVLAGKRNITASVQEAHMDPWAITRIPARTPFDDRDPLVLRLLLKIGAVEKSGDDYLAKWLANRELRVPLRKSLDQRVELRYLARPAFVPGTFDQIVTSSRERDYCLSDLALRRIAPFHPAMRRLTIYEYTIETGIDGKSPSSTTLEMSPGDGDRVASKALIFVCGPHRKAIAAVGTVKRQPADVDEHGRLHVLSVVESPGVSR